MPWFTRSQPKRLFSRYPGTQFSPPICGGRELSVVTVADNVYLLVNCRQCGERLNGFGRIVDYGNDRGNVVISGGFFKLDDYDSATRCFPLTWHDDELEDRQFIFEPAFMNTPTRFDDQATREPDPTPEDPLFDYRKKPYMLAGPSLVTLSDKKVALFYTRGEGGPEVPGNQENFSQRVRIGLLNPSDWSATHWTGSRPVTDSGGANVNDCSATTVDHQGNPRFMAASCQNPVAGDVSWSLHVSDDLLNWHHKKPDDPGFPRVAAQEVGIVALEDRLFAFSRVSANPTTAGHSSEMYWQMSDDGGESWTTALPLANLGFGVSIQVGQPRFKPFQWEGKSLLLTVFIPTGPIDQGRPYFAGVLEYAPGQPGKLQFVRQPKILGSTEVLYSTSLLIDQDRSKVLMFGSDPLFGKGVWYLVEELQWFMED